MLRISAHDKQTGELLTTTDVVIPVSQETDCKNCHATGKVATLTEDITWSNEADLEIQAKWNILKLHDAKHATELTQKTPVLCANCLSSIRPWKSRTARFSKEFSYHVTSYAVEHLSGDNLKMHSDGIRLTQVYVEGDLSASPITAQNKRFAENSATLFRNSKGHGGVACKGCHGSTHAIWANPIADANDNITATQLQGHTGTIIECKTCHTDNSVTTGGPHGMHNVNNLAWIDHRHEKSYKSNPKNCQTCHGTDLKGTVLAKMATTRSFKIEGKNVTLNKGEQIACNRCHSLPH